VSRFLTAHQRSLGYLVPVMVGKLKKEKKNMEYMELKSSRDGEEFFHLNPIWH